MFHCSQATSDLTHLTRYMNKRQIQTKINLFQQALQVEKKSDLARGLSLLINTTSRETIMLTSPATLIFSYWNRLSF